MQNVSCNEVFIINKQEININRNSHKQKKTNQQAQNFIHHYNDFDCSFFKPFFIPLSKTSFTRMGNSGMVESNSIV